MKESAKHYHPVLVTLRLYAGWLLACLFVVFAIGSYQQLRSLPFSSDLLREWIESPMVLQVTFLTFLFLMLTSIHRLLGRGIWKGLLLAAIGFFLLVLFRVNS